MQTAEAHATVETQPFRAIFEAYDSVLPAYGIDPAHDQIYLRFLFKLGDKRNKTESLFESFERLLEELGIQIEFDAEDTEEVQAVGIGHHVGNPNTKHSPARRSRRASFNSVYDAEGEITEAGRARPDSQASLSQLYSGEQAFRDSRPSTRATTRPTEKIRSRISAPRLLNFQAPRGRLTAEQFKEEPQNAQASHVPQLSQAAQQAYSRAPFKTKHAPILGDVASSRIDLSRSAGIIPHASLDESPAIGSAIQPIHPNPWKPLHVPSRTQLLRDADTFQHYRIISVVRDIVDRWCEAALQANNHHEHIERMAVAHDTEILLRQAFEHWRARLHARKQAAETKQFFKRLESRAVKARNLYLLTKAFTHWVQCAQDEAHEKLLAKRHVLATKYFHAWRDITIENQDKVHFQGLKKFFRVWERRYVQRLTEEITANLHYQQSLSKYGYWRWFWNFCERRAPEWRTRRLKQKAVLKWSDRFRGIKRRNLAITQTQISKMQMHHLSLWVKKARLSSFNNRQAIFFNQTNAFSRCLETWSRSQQFAPIGQQISNLVDWRVAGTTFAVFVNRFRLEKQAERINGLRILRSGWTHWNDRLRWQTLASRIQDRYLLEALYRWVISERYVLLQRLSEQRLKRQHLQQWRWGYVANQGRRDECLRRIEDQRAHASMKNVLLTWRNEYGEQRNAEQIAFEFHAPKMTHEAIERWKEALAHTQDIELWAKDAAFFFLGKRYLRLWWHATSESKRKKRREAYVQVRRQSKMNLASALLQRWRNTSAHIQELRRHGDNADQHHILRTASSLLNVWKNSLDLNLDAGLDALEHYEQRLTRRLLRLWSSHANDQWQMEETAVATSDLRVQKTAFNILRQFQLKIIESRGQQGNANGLRLNYERRHYQALVRIWRDKLAARQNRPSQPPSFSARSRRTKRFVEDDQLGVTRRLEDWTEFDAGDWIPNIEAETSTTPLPGYLSTPSKRAARAKALVQSTTPAGTPFQNRLRAQLNSTSKSAKQGPFKRSVNITSSNFGAILEDSPELPDRGSGNDE